MNNKNLYIGVTAFVVGATCGYFLGVARVKKQYQEAAADTRDFYNQKLTEFGVMDRDFTPAHELKNPNYEEEIEEEEKEYLEQVTQYATVPQVGTNNNGKPINLYNKPPLTVIARQHEDEDEGDEEVDYDDEETDEDYEAELDERAEELAQRRHENESAGLPYVINFDEYEDAPEGYTKQILYYYAIDRVLCEDDDTIVEDEEELIGLDYEDILDMQTTAWVRNDSTLNLYAIKRIDDSYNETIAGLVESPKERDIRITSRRKYGMDH